MHRNQTVVVCQFDRTHVKRDCQKLLMIAAANTHDVNRYTI
jgi:hypothetical protein